MPFLPEHKDYFQMIDINGHEIKFDHTNMSLPAAGNMILSLSAHKGQQCMNNEDYDTYKWITSACMAHNQ